MFVQVINHSIQKVQKKKVISSSDTEDLILQYNTIATQSYCQVTNKFMHWECVYKKKCIKNKYN